MLDFSNWSCPFTMMFFVPKNAHRNRHDPTARLVSRLLPRSARSQARHGSLVRPTLLAPLVGFGLHDTPNRQNLDGFFLQPGLASNSQHGNWLSRPQLSPSRFSPTRQRVGLTGRFTALCDTDKSAKFHKFHALKRREGAETPKTATALT